MTSGVTGSARPTSCCRRSRRRGRRSRRRSSAHLVWRQPAQGLDDGGQGHLGLLGHVGRAGHVVGRAADEAGAGVTCTQQVAVTVNSSPRQQNSPVPEPTLVFHCEMSGHQRRGLTSDPCGEGLGALSLVVLDDLNLQGRERDLPESCDPQNSARTKARTAEDEEVTVGARHSHAAWLTP